MYCYNNITIVYTYIATLHLHPCMDRGVTCTVDLQIIVKEILM